MTFAPYLPRWRLARDISAHRRRLTDHLGPEYGARYEARYRDAMDTITGGVCLGYSYDYRDGARP